MRFVQRPSSSRAAQTASALSRHASAHRSSPVQSSIACATSIVPGAPHMISTASLPTLARTSAKRSSASSELGSIRQATRIGPLSPAKRAASGWGGRSVHCSKSGRSRQASSVRREAAARSIAVSAWPLRRRRSSPSKTPARSDVQVLEGRRRLVRVPFLGGPEPDRVEVGVGVRDDPADRVAGPLLVPGRLGQRLVQLGPEEHADIIELRKVPGPALRPRKARHVPDYFAARPRVPRRARRRSRCRAPRPAA